MSIAPALGFGVLSGCAILLGGTIALRLGEYRIWLKAVSAGAILAIALTMLLPGAVDLARGAVSVETLCTVAALGFAGYLLLDRAVSAGASPLDPHIGPATLFAHAMLDGLIAGLGFSISHGIGLMLAGVAMAHGLAHGINTIALAFERQGGAALARRWLIANACAPIGGAAIAGVLALTGPQLAVVVALLAGVFLFIASVELMPRGGGSRLAHYAALVATSLLVIGAHHLLDGH